MYRQLALESHDKTCEKSTRAWAVFSDPSIPDCAQAVVCTADQLEQVLTSDISLIQTCAAVAENDYPLDFDHRYVSSTAESPKEKAPAVLLYGMIGTPEFHAMHLILKDRAEKGEIHYIFRHYPIESTDPTLLHGYGVALDIKNTEYKTVDDSSNNESTEETQVQHDDEQEDDDLFFSVLMKRQPELAEELKKFRKHLAEKAGGKDAKAWELKDLGYSAVQEIQNAKNPLQRLQEISQDFPKYAKMLSISGGNVSKELKKEIEANRAVIKAEYLEDSVFVNGVKFDPSNDKLNAFDLLRILRKEFALVSKFDRLNIDQEFRLALWKKAGEIADKSSTFRIDTRTESTGPVFLNNVATDAYTRRWSTNVEDLVLKAGNIVMLRKNMYEIIVVVDPTSSNFVEVIGTLLFFIQRGAPINCGLVFTSAELLDAFASTTDVETFMKTHAVDEKVDIDESSGTVATAWHVTQIVALVSENSEQQTTLQFLHSLARLIEGYDTITVKELVDLYVEATSGNIGTTEAKKKAKEALGENKHGVYAYEMTQYVVEKGLQLNVHLFNGILTPSLKLQEKLMQQIGQDQALYMGLVQSDVIDDDSDMYDELLQSLNTYTAYIPDMDRATPKTFVTFSETFAKLRYYHAANSIMVPKRQSLIVVADLDSTSGAQLARDAFLAVMSDAKKHLRVSVVHNPSSTVPTQGSLMAQILSHLGDSDDDQVVKVLSEMLLILSSEEVRGVEAFASRVIAKVIKDKSKENDKIQEIEAMLQSTVDYDSLYRTSQMLCQSFRVKTGDNGVFLNGRKVALEKLDRINILLRYDMNQQTREIAKVLNLTKHPLDTIELAREQSDLMMKAGAVVGEFSLIERKSYVETEKLLKTKHSQLLASGQEEKVEIVAFLDPLSESTQRISSLFSVLHEQLKLTVRIYLLPKASYSEYPLKRFYRFTFGSSENYAQFNRLPIQPVLTLKLETPESWNVQILKTQEDLDNLRVDQKNLARTAVAEFQLKNLLAAGQCHDITSPYLPPPNGLELHLTRGNGTPRQQLRDTLVMQNLGYFQFQATPGVWDLQLAPGRAAGLYEIAEQESKKLQKIVIRDFDTDILQLSVRKQVGKESEQLLDASASEGGKGQGENGGIWSKVSSYFSPSAKTRSGETIHVFSLASGHLYERFLRIMMLSVLKRTSNPVQFWLLENFLSPAFKDSIPTLKSKFGIEITLVTYKWPMWLRQQTEKQRIIWGYKILFLDVLFPLNVDKIIYVDADQVVRADLKELWEMDLQDKVYGYTPFCASRKETLGFQFWRSGYWKDHLQGRPYHISALYVVDLAKFRHTATGDRLRAIYDQLSRDPNSLSNLDQDLPNFAQHQIPIHSLPQEWLWCESWCSDESKEKAKTIDLCNNPLHKEPKLDMAKRVISGELFPEDWVELDQEIQQAIQA